MKTLRKLLLGLALASTLIPLAEAHGPRVGLSISLGYPVFAPPPIYYAPPPVVYVPPPRPLYVGPPVVVAPYRYPVYDYYPAYDYGPRSGPPRRWRQHRH